MSRVTAGSGPSLVTAGWGACKDVLIRESGQGLWRRPPEIAQAIQVNFIPAISPDQQEIQRRRELVRAPFNDFWNGRDDKPVTFVDRLNQAETYLNEQLTARGEPWQLDANTRKMLGLPPR
jgi:hypothetical protein